MARQRRSRIASHSGRSGGGTTTTRSTFERVALMEHHVKVSSGDLRGSPGGSGAGRRATTEACAGRRPGAPRVGARGSARGRPRHRPAGRGSGGHSGRPSDRDWSAAPSGSRPAVASSRTSRTPRACSISAAVIGPGRRMRARRVVRSRTVDSRPTRRLSAVEDQVDPAVEVFEDVAGQGGRDPRRTVGAGRGDRAAGVRRSRTGRPRARGSGRRRCPGRP